MITYNYLPGVNVVTVDGGLAALRVPQGKAILIVGTSGIGPGATPYQVVDRASAAATFGTLGTLAQAMEEAAAGGADNLYLYRMGTVAATLSGVGATSGANAGLAVTLGECAATAGTDYTAWYDGVGVFYLWLNGNLVYANDVAAGVTVDTGDSIVSGTPGAGLAFGAQTGVTAKTAAGAVTLAAAAALAASGSKLPPHFAPAVTGLGMTARQTYVALDQAFDLLGNFAVEQVYCPDVVMDTPNVAFYVSTDSTTAANNPSGNSTVLDWLLTTKDVYGDKTYRWASETTDSAGNISALPTFLNALDRLNQGYHEVNFPYAISRFCFNQSANPSAVIGGCLGFIAATGPANGRFDLPTLRTWIGVLPTYAPPVGTQIVGNPITPGRGLLGTPFLTGTMAGKLNSLCADANSGFRAPGLFDTLTGEYDGVANTDRNGNPVDIGAYLHVVGDYAYMSNGVGTYVGTIAGLVCGICSMLDEKTALTNQTVNGVTQLYRAGLGQLDALAEANVDMLRFVQAGSAPVLLRDNTAATQASDYNELLRQRIKFLVIEQLLTVAEPFIGQSTTDGLQLTAMQTNLDTALTNMQKRGYISKYTYTVSTTAADQRVGRAFIDVAFYPADELVQLRATVGISR
jgi:hypothetical protein